MKNLIFCLLLLTGAGMLNSCQQDEVVNETPASKEIVIRASLPSDAQSRVTFDAPREYGNALVADILWEEGDVITMVASGGKEYYFEIDPKDNGCVNANFIYRDNNTENEEFDYPTGEFTFTYGNQPMIGYVQAGTKDDLNQYHLMRTVTDKVTITNWNNVGTLYFKTKVALVEITLPSDIEEAKVSLYDANKNACLAYTSQKTFENDKAYFAIPPGTYNGLVFVETSAGDVYMQQYGNGTLSENSLYRVNGLTQISGTKIGSSNVSYYIYNEVDGAIEIVVYGQGAAIPEEAFFQKDPISPSSVIILDGINKIGDKAFQQCDKLAKVAIPATVERIGADAFKQAINGCCITIMCDTPPTLGGDRVFGHNTNNNYKIFVLDKTKYYGKEYWNHYYDNNIFNINN